MATCASCGFAAPSDATVGAHRRVTSSRGTRFRRPTSGSAAMRLAARRLTRRLGPKLGGANEAAGGQSSKRVPALVRAADRPYGANANGGTDGRVHCGDTAHRNVGDTTRRTLNSRQTANASVAPSSSLASRPWTSAPDASIAAPRVPKPTPTDASGPSFELWGPDEDVWSVGGTAGGVQGSMPPMSNQSPSQNTTASFATLRGEIARVTFHNADNFYTVARVRVASTDASLLPIGATAVPNGPEGSQYNKYKKRKGKKGKSASSEKIVTVVGHIPGAAEGSNLEMTGDWRDVEKWGTQFVLNATPKEITPTDAESTCRYLAGGVLPGVGKATAEKLVNHFGVDVFEVFDSPDAELKLRQCPGIGAKTAEKLAKSWGDSRGRRDASRFLEQHGVVPALAQRVASVYGVHTERKVTEDPFAALSGIRGATFHRCDALAARLGKAPDAEPRLAAAMLRVLQQEATSEGHVYAPWSTLTEGVTKLVGHRQAAGLRPGALEAAADLLLKRGDIAVAGDIRNSDNTSDTLSEEVFHSTAKLASKTADFETNRDVFWNKQVIAVAVLHDTEACVALDIAHRLSQPKREPDVPRVRRWLQAAADKEGWRLLSPAQEAFLDLALREPISVLTGGPGTGKTFATHIAVRLWRAMGKKVLMCAPTGRAAQRLAEIASAGRRMSAPVQSSTIHRLLETRRGKGGGKNEDDDNNDSADNDSSLSYKGHFARDKDSPLDADIIVVDESSMLDLPLCAALLDAIKPDAQVVFVGDADQLPSVGPGSVLRDILNSGAVPAVQLKDVFRQAEQSGIIRAAHAINNGNLPQVPVKRWDPVSWSLVDNQQYGVAGGSVDSNVNESAQADSSWSTADCAWITLPDDSPAGYEGALEQLFGGALPVFSKLDPARDVQVLTPFRRGPASTSQLNAFLQARLNPPLPGKLETKGAFDVVLREGDRVLQQRNDYTKEVFNGDLGTIVAVGGNGSVRVVFGNQSSSVDEKDGDGEKLGKSSSSKTEKTNTIDPIQRALDSLAHGAREVQYKKSELRDLIPAWALTVHKAQGSEYRAVVLCLAAHHRPLLRRELVYTAVSRAKEALIVLAPPVALSTAVNCVGNDRRVTTLARRLKPLAPEAPSCPATAAVAAAKDLLELKRKAEEENVTLEEK